LLDRLDVGLEQARGADERDPLRRQACPDGRLALLIGARQSGVADEEQGIYRAEVRAMMLALLDIREGVDRIAGYIEGEDDGEEEEEDLPDA
jgi:hypothetical protein